MPKTAREHLQKAAVGYVVNTDQAEGIVEAIVNVFGIVDTQSDIIHPGAYKKSLNERGNQIRVKVLDNHQAHSVVNIVAKALDIHEVNRAQLPEEVRSQWPDATGGLYAKMQFMLDDPTSLAVFKRIDFGASNEYSIGLEIVDQDFSIIKAADGKQVRVRNIRQLALFDVSPVIWGANEATATTAVKGVTKFEDLPLAARGRAWDAGAADTRVRAWAGAEDAPNAKYAQAFFWNDGEADDTFGGYKLGFADIVDGTLTAIPRGIFAVAGVLNGARGGVDIPDADQSAVKAAVSKYYDKMAKTFDDDSIVVPWQTEDVEGKDMGSTSGAQGGFTEPNEDPSAAERGKRESAVQERLRKALAKKRQNKNDEAQTLGSWFMGAMLTMTNDCAEDLLSDGCIDLNGYKSVSDALMAALVAFQSALPEELAMMAYPHDDYDDWFSWFSRGVPDAKADASMSGKPLTAAKEGRKLSTATKSKLDDIHKAINGAAGDLRTLIDDTDLEAAPFGSEGEEAEGEKRKAEPDTRPLTFDDADVSRRLEALNSVNYPQ